MEFLIKAWFKNTQFCISSITFSVQLMIKKMYSPNAMHRFLLKCNAQVLKGLAPAFQQSDLKYSAPSEVLTHILSSFS